MTTAKLYALLTLLKAYRAALTWSLSTGRGRDDQDQYRKHADEVIRDVRFALEHGGFYRIPSKQIAA